MVLRTMRFSLALLVIACAAVLLFARLGHHALWGDEAGTALVAKGVLRTGSTSALVDDCNIFAYDNGRQLKKLHERYMPPLQSYLVAPFLAAFGRQSAWAARLPFALCGLASIILILWWLWHEEVRLLIALLMCLGLVCNVSLFLYSRQCRYYGAALLSSIAVVCLYLRWNGQRRRLIAMAALSLCLLASN
jgi:predicted membrane-bound mannosyltransferase